MGLSKPESTLNRIGDRYRLVQEIARGGMGVVYRAVDEATGREVALKQLLLERTSGARNVTLFEREYQTLRTINHPRIIRVFDYGCTEHGPYYTMELLEGHDLYDHRERSLREVCSILRDVATSLALLHVRRLIHRDITPRNIRLMADGHAKLLDFGALVSFGVSRELVGTPPFVPPEALAMQALDQRSDLFSLGALGYWLLTGHHAFPARNLEELKSLWTLRIVPPSSEVPDLPPELERLILSMLAHEPDARPASAAEVIDRLNVIAGLAEEHEDDVTALAHAYLRSAPMVGRETQLARVNASFAQAMQKSGSAWLIEAEPGMGRTRFLTEASIAAQLLGATVLSVDAGGADQPLSTACRLVDRLLDAAPVTAVALAKEQLDLLASLDPALAQRLGVGQRTRVTSTPGQWRAELHRALCTWITAVADRQLLVLMVDNVDRADEASQALLVSLAEEAFARRLVLVMSTTRSAGPSQVMRALSERCEALELPSLSHAASAQLVQTIFGSAPHVGRFSEWLHAATAGSPLYTVELVRRLLDRGVLRYHDGLWTLPTERPEIGLPKGLEDVLMARISELSPGARNLAEALAVQRGAMPLDRWAALAESQGEVNVHILLDELTRTGMLVDDGQGHRFASDAARSTLLSAMSEAQKQLRHRELALLLSRGRGQLDSFVRVEIGRHLMEGGELERGADLIYELLGTPHEAERIIDGLHTAAPVVARALDVYRSLGRSIYEQIPLIACLTASSYYVDFRWANQYGETAVELLERATCMPLAKRLSPFLGGKLALVIALGTAYVLFIVRKPRRVAYTFAFLIEKLFSEISTLSGSAAVQLDKARVQRLSTVLAPFAVLDHHLTPVGAYEYVRHLDLPLSERLGETHEQWSKVVAKFEDPTFYTDLPPHARALFLGGAWSVLGICETFRTGDGALRFAQRLDGTGVMLHRVFAHQLRAAYYANRGFLEEAARYRAHVETHAMQVGSAWQVEVWECGAMLLVSLTTGDVVAVKRISDRLATFSREIPALKNLAQQAKAALHYVRGELSASIETYGAALTTDDPMGLLGWSSAAPFRASALNHLGRHAQAKAECEAVLSHLSETDRTFVVRNIWTEIELSIAQAGLGELSQAEARLDGLIASPTTADNPLILGSLHQARARVALLARDNKAFDLHLAHTKRWFASTHTPALIARGEELAALGSSLTLPLDSLPVMAARDMEESLAGCDSEHQRARRALEVLLKLTNTHSGVLFRFNEGKLDPVASEGDANPSHELYESLLRQARELDETSSTATDNPEEDEQLVPLTSGTSQGFRTFLLTTIKQGAFVTVGAVALATAPTFVEPMYPSLEVVARTLSRTWDPQTVKRGRVAPSNSN